MIIRRFAGILAATTAFLVSSTAMAHAGPLFLLIGNIVISSFLAVGAGALLPTISAAALGSFVVSSALLGLSLANSLFNRPKIDPGRYNNTFENAETPELFAHGHVVMKGLKAFGNTAKDGGTNTVYRWIWHAAGPLEARLGYRVGGRPITVEANGAVSAPPWFKAPPPLEVLFPLIGTSGGQDSWLYLKTNAGDGDEVVFPELLAAFPDLIDEDFRGRGIVSTLAMFKSPGVAHPKFQKLFQAFNSEVELEARMVRVYDPREVGHDIDDSATWEYSINGPLCVAHYLRRMPGFGDDGIDWADLALEATKAEVATATLTGTEPRSTFSGKWDGDVINVDLIDQMLESIGARVVDLPNGKVSIRLIDDAPQAELVFSAKFDLNKDLRYGPEGVERPNVCRVSYFSLEHGTEMPEIDLTGKAWARVEGEIDRYGPKELHVKLPFCPSPSQAQRIARRQFELARAPVGEAVANYAGLGLWGVYIADLEFPDIGGEQSDPTTKVSRCLIGPPRVDDNAGTVDYTYIVWPPALVDAPWNPAVMEAPPPEPTPDVLYPTELETPDEPGPAIMCLYDGVPEIRLAHTLKNAGMKVYSNYRHYDGPNPSEWFRMGVVTDQSVSIAIGDREGFAADFRVAEYNEADDDVSNFSPIHHEDELAYDNTPCGAPTLSNPLYDPGGGGGP